MPSATNYKKTILLSCCLCLLMIARLYAQPKQVPDIYQQTSEVNNIMVKYNADYGNLQRFYTIANSPERRQRLLSTVNHYIDTLNTLDFDKLNTGTKVDYLLFNRDLHEQQYQLRKEETEYNTIKQWVPFADTIYAMEKLRRRGAVQDAQLIANELNTISKSVKALQQKWNKQSSISFECGYLGSYKNEAKDAATYANWGVDYLKYDWCSYDGVAKNGTSSEAYIKPYALMDAALQSTNRSIVYSLCQYGMKDVWKWGQQVHAQSWRTTEDIEDTWQSMAGIGFSRDSLFSYAVAGHWNDPDMMLVGQVGWGENLHPARLTPDEQYTHVSLWCMLSAPLLIGCDLSKLDAFTMNLLTNSEVLATDQDVPGKQAQRIIKNDSNQVWIKELANGSHAIAIFNIGTAWQNITTSWKDLGLNNEQTVRDVWRQKDMGIIKGEYKTKVSPHGVMLIKVNG